MMMKKETAKTLIELLKELNTYADTTVDYDGRVGRLTDRCDRTRTVILGTWTVPTVEELLKGLHYRVMESKKCTYYGADRNEDWVVTINGHGSEPWRNSYGVLYPALDDEGAQALIEQLLELAEKAKAKN